VVAFLKAIEDAENYLALEDAQSGVRLGAMHGRLPVPI
jgi:hypothetical protein